MDKSERIANYAVLGAMGATGLFFTGIGISEVYKLASEGNRQIDPYVGWSYITSMPLAAAALTLYTLYRGIAEGRSENNLEKKLM